MKLKTAFQTLAIELQKQTKKENIMLVISSIRISVVAKTDDEIYVLSIMKIYSYFLFVFCIVLKRVELLKIAKVMQLLLKSLLPYKNGIEEENKFFGQSLLNSVVFRNRKCYVFGSSFGSCPLPVPDWLQYDCMGISAANTIDDIYSLVDSSN